MSKKNIVIASVLKPITDVRLYHKIGKSLSQTFPDLYIHIIAFQSQNLPQDKDFTFYPIFDFKRLNLKRFLANYFFFKKLLKIKPQFCIISTFELLPATLFYKCFYKCQLIYDIQENYYKNIVYTKVFPKCLRVILAFGVRMIEWCASHFVKLFFLAEQCYEKELSFLKNKNYIILENKISQKTLAQFERKVKSKEGKHFLYSGTISTDYGIFQVINFIQELYEIDNDISLKIIGYASKSQERQKIKSLIDKLPYVELITDNKPLPYSDILNAYLEADFALMPYQVNKSVENRIPTKFYECLHFRVPMMIQNNQTWESFLSKLPFQSAYFLDFTNLESIKKSWVDIQNIDFYKKNIELNSIYWENEEKKLIEAWKSKGINYN